MVKKKMWHEEDDNIYHDTQENKSDWDRYGMDKFKGIYHKTSGNLAKSPLDQGRNCPRCAGRLELKEITEINENIYLYCKRCGLEVFAEDIDRNDEIADALYRNIPDNVFLYWGELINKER